MQKPGCLAQRLITDDAGKQIVGMEYEQDGQTHLVRADLFVLSAGAINSALLLQRSADGKNPKGLANSSGCVGRYYMNHNTSCLMGMMPFTVNHTQFTKTLGVNDFYNATADYPFPMGHIQLLGNIQEPMIRSAVPTMPRWAGRLISRPFGIETPSHQCGTVRMGLDPATAALDPWCRAYDHPNLFVVDASFFPSSAALNPALTVAAQSPRVGSYLRKHYASL
jgi:choline dehydrogenase-like flavoprotein